MSIWWSLHLRREAASVPLARRLLLGTMETAGVDPEISYELAVALSEACANAVEHGAGNRSDAYHVSACIDGDTCHIEVTDTGPGFPATPPLEPLPGPPVEQRRPEQQQSGRQPSGRQQPVRSSAQQPAEVHPSDPTPDRLADFPEDSDNGRGLFLIETLSDHVRFRNRPNSGGAVVSFDKILKWRDDALLKAG